MVRALIMPMIGKSNTANLTVKYFPSDIDAEIFPEQWTRSMGLLPSRRLLQKITKFEPDVIFADSPIYSTWYAKLYNLFKKNKIRLITRLQGDPWLEHMDVLTRTMANIRSIPFQEALYIMLRNPYVYFLFDRTLKASDRIITVSHWLKDRVQNHLDSQYIDVIHLAIDPDSLYEDGKFEFKHPNVGLLQNMLVHLKLDGLLTFKRVIQQLSSIDFYIGGGGPLLPQVKHHFKNLKNVHFLGPIKNIKRFFASIDVYVHASGLDCCPVTVMEASFMKKPVLGSKIGGIPELIEDGVTGWSIRNNDTDQWVEKISHLLQNEKLLKKMGRAGRVRVEENFTWEVVSKQIANALIDVVRDVK